MRVRAVYGAVVLPELRATFAGGCLLITAINLPADRGLERHVARALRGSRRQGVDGVRKRQEVALKMPSWRAHCARGLKK